MSDDRLRPPEEDHADEALLWRSWAEDSIVDSDVELPEDILGLLDGRTQGDAAAAARRRLAEDPRLARAFGELAAMLRDSGDVPAVDPPGPHVVDLMAPALAPPEPKPRRFDFWRELFRSPAPVAFATMAAVAVVFFALRPPADSPPPTLRGDAAAGVALMRPTADAVATGDVPFTWEPFAGAQSYVLVLLSTEPTGGIRTFPAEGPELTLRAAELGNAPATFTWSVRARLADGRELSSAPRTLRWRGPNSP